MPDQDNPFKIAGGGLMSAALTNIQLNKLAEPKGLGLAKAGKTDIKEAEAAATQFEALLLQQMMKSMWATVPNSGLLSGSQEEGLYRDMLNEGIAKDVAEKQGIGIKEVILRDMKKFGKL